MIVVPFKEGTVPGLQPQGGFLKEQEGSVPFKSSLERTLAASSVPSNCLLTLADGSLHATSSASLTTTTTVYCSYAPLFMSVGLWHRAYLLPE